MLNAAWKIIKSWLPAAGVKKIKFLTKSNLAEYIPEDQQLVIWGGKDAWEYEFVEENFSAYNVATTSNGTTDSPYILHQDDTNAAENRPKSLHLVNGDSFDQPPSYAVVSSGDMDGRKKSVTFATNSPSSDSIVSQISPNTPASTHAINIPESIQDASKMFI